MEQEIGAKDDFKCRRCLYFWVMLDMEQEIDYQTMNNASNESGTRI